MNINLYHQEKKEPEFNFKVKKKVENKKLAKNKICPKCLTDSTYEVFTGILWRCYKCNFDIK